MHVDFSLFCEQAYSRDFFIPEQLKHMITSLIK